MARPKELAMDKIRAHGVGFPRDARRVDGDVASLGQREPQAEAAVVLLDVVDNGRAHTELGAHLRRGAAWHGAPGPA